jgi:hypothetical protein
VAEGLSSKHEALRSNSNITKKKKKKKSGDCWNCGEEGWLRKGKNKRLSSWPGMTEHCCNPSTQEAEAGKS